MSETDEQHMRAALAQSLVDISGTLPSDFISQCAAHWALVRQWNARCNLTAISQPDDAAWLHYRDSLAALTVLTHGPVLDIGSGAGFPGIPLALARPDWSFTLLEPRHKRASFLQTAISRLGVRNVKVMIGRSDQALPESTASQDHPFAAAVTRATFSGEQDLLACLRWLQPGGKLIAYRSDGLVQDQNEVDRRASLAESGCQLYAYTLRSTPRALAVWTKP